MSARIGTGQNHSGRAVLLCRVCFPFMLIPELGGVGLVCVFFSSTHFTDPDSLKESGLNSFPARAGDSTSGAVSEGF